MGDTALFDIRGACRIRIRGLARHALEDLNEKYAHFRVEDRGDADIHVDIGPFRPDLAGTTHVDHQYYLRRDYVYFTESLPGIFLEAEINGLEGNRTEVRFHAKASPFKPAHLLYPDLLLHSHLLQPLLEANLGLKGFFLLHGRGWPRAGAPP